MSDSRWFSFALCAVVLSLSACSGNVVTAAGSDATSTSDTKAGDSACPTGQSLCPGCGGSFCSTSTAACPEFECADTSVANDSGADVSDGACTGGTIQCDVCGRLGCYTGSCPDVFCPADAIVTTDTGTANPETATDTAIGSSDAAYACGSLVCGASTYCVASSTPSGSTSNVSVGCTQWPNQCPSTSETCACLAQNGFVGETDVCEVVGGVVQIVSGTVIVTATDAGSASSDAASTCGPLTCNATSQYCWITHEWEGSGYNDSDNCVAWPAACATTHTCACLTANTTEFYSDCVVTNGLVSATTDLE